MPPLLPLTRLLRLRLHLRLHLRLRLRLRPPVRLPLPVSLCLVGPLPLPTTRYDEPIELSPLVAALAVILQPDDDGEEDEEESDGAAFDEYDSGHGGGVRLAARAEACAVVRALALQHEDAFASEKLRLWHANAARRDGRAGVTAAAAAAAGARARASDFAVASVPLRALLWRGATSRHAPLAAQALAALRSLLLPLQGQSPPLLLGSGLEEAKTSSLRQARPQALGPSPSIEPEP